MAYDPIINYYDKPGGPSVPGSDSGSGGDEGGGGGGNVVVVPYEDDMSNLRITLGLTAGEVIEYLQAGATLVLDLTESHVYGGLVCFINWVRKQDNGGNITYRTETPDGRVFYAQGLTERFSAYFGD